MLSAAEKEEHSGHVPALVMHLMSPSLDCGRNMTTDNYFTSKPLAEKLCDRRTTLVGTLKANSRCLPALATSIDDRCRGNNNF